MKMKKFECGVQAPVFKNGPVAYALNATRLPSKGDLQISHLETGDRQAKVS